MPDAIPAFLLHWLVTALALWAASRVFTGLRFATASDLLLSAILLGFGNAIVRPVLIVLTLPLTLLSLGLFILVINGVIIVLVSRLVRGFTVDNFRTAVLAGIFISVFGFLLNYALPNGATPHPNAVPHSGFWL